MVYVRISTALASLNPGSPRSCTRTDSYLRCTTQTRDCCVSGAMRGRFPVIPDSPRSTESGVRIRSYISLLLVSAPPPNRGTRLALGIIEFTGHTSTLSHSPATAVTHLKNLLPVVTQQSARQLFRSVMLGRSKNKNPNGEPEVM